MKPFFLLLTLTSIVFAEKPVMTPNQLATIVLRENPELRFYEVQVAALPKAVQTTAPKIDQPLDFPAREAFRRAVLNLDRDLAQLYLAEFRYILANDTRLKAMEYQTASETAATANDLAERISALITMLEERPAAGIESLIERRILEGAALPFIRKAVEAKIQAAVLHTQLNGLLGRKLDTPLMVKGPRVLPGEIVEGPAAESLLIKIREAEIARGLAGLEAVTEIEPFAIGGWFTRQGLGASEPATGVTRPGPTSGATSKQISERLLDDARRKLAREIIQREAAVIAAREVVNAISPALVENLQSASDLAERQYRVGALGVNLLIEIHQEYLNALEARNDAILQLWRNTLDLELLTLPASGQPTGKITVDPKP